MLLVYRPGRGWLSLSICLIAFLVVDTSPCCGQSSVIQLPDSSANNESVALQVESKTGQIETSLSRQVLRVEQRLANMTPESWRGEMRFGDLLDRMEKAGYQIFLDESAADNSLDHETNVRLALRSASIETNLLFALRAFQCSFVVTDSGVIHILSEDAELDIDNMPVVSLKISNIAADYLAGEDIVGLIQETIDPDSWEENGGNGRMVLADTNGELLLTITQTWINHQRVRRLLESHHRLGGRATGRSSRLAGTGGRYSGSRPIQLPEEYMAQRRNRRGMALPGSGTTGGFGGGAGLGGGVF